MSKMIRFALPLLFFIGLGWFLLKGLDKDPRALPSVLIDKPVPTLSLPTLDNGDISTSLWGAERLKGQVWLLNVWASWCSACVQEHPVLNKLAQSKALPIIGLAWKDAPKLSQAWLAKHGNPYTVVIVDQVGKAAIDLGVYGAPESFLIDKQGRIRYKQVGPFTPESIEQQLLPMARKLSAE